VARLLFIGHDESKGGGFPVLRTWSMRRALERNGHSLICFPISADLVDRPETQTELLRLSSECDAAVTAGPFLPARILDCLAETCPIWLDWPSDPLADAHARSHAPAGGLGELEWAAVTEAAAMGLHRGDAFGVIGSRQRLATLGQLLLTGRREQILQDMVHSVPIAFDFPHPMETPKPHPADGFLRVALCGSANTWLDDGELCRGLDRAMNRLPGLEVCILGGPVAGHYIEGWKRMVHWAEGHPGRVDLEEWPEQEAFLRKMRDCHVGVWLDRPGMEPLLGSRTRALLYAWLGLEMVGSPATELASELEELGALRPARNAIELCKQLEQIAEAPRPQELRIREQAQLARRLSPALCYAPLLGWLEDPRRIPCNASAQAEMAAQLAALRRELKSVHSSATWRVGSRLHRLVGRFAQHLPPPFRRD
jgi:hypothetical protein